jgi:hypothetical protein
MGTGREWIQVLLVGALFGAYTGSIGWIRWTEPAKLCKQQRNCFFLFYPLSSLSVGLMFTFGNRMFRPPLVFLGIVLILALFAIGTYSWRLRGQLIRT